MPKKIIIQLKTSDNASLSATLTKASAKAAYKRLLQRASKVEERIKHIILALNVDLAEVPGIDDFSEEEDAIDEYEATLKGIEDVLDEANV